MDVKINDIKAKAAVYDYVMNHITDKDFESVAAVAGDVLRIIIDAGEVINR